MNNGWHYYNGEPLTDEEWERVQANPQGFLTATMVLGTQRYGKIEKEKDTLENYLDYIGYRTPKQAEHDIKNKFSFDILSEYKSILQQHLQQPSLESAKELYDFLASHKSEDDIYFVELEYQRVYEKKFISKIIPCLVGSCLDRKNILDVGCWIGFSTNYLAENNPYARFIGIDISEKSLNIARENAKKFNLHNVEYRVANLLNLRDSFEEDSFDSVLLVDVLDDTSREGNINDFMLDEKIEEVSRITQEKGLVTIKFTKSGKYGFDWEKNLPKLLKRHNIDPLDHNTKIEFTFSNGNTADSFIFRGVKNGCL